MDRYFQNEDYKIHPDKYKTSDIIPEGDGEISPRVPVVKGHRRKPSSKSVHICMCTIVCV